METSGDFINLDDKGDEFSLVYNQLIETGSGSSREAHSWKKTDTDFTNIADGLMGLPSCAVFVS
jgi:hypothetical protein